MEKFRISPISKSAANIVGAARRRWRRNANLNELAALDAGRLADIGLEGAARDAILGRAVGTTPRL